MSIFSKLFGTKSSSAQNAKNRLTVMLSHERSANAFPFIDDLRKDLIEVIKKYTDVQDINIKSSNDRNLDFLEVEITLRKSV